MKQQLKKTRLIIALFVVALTTVVVFQACEKILPPGPEENAVLDGKVPGLTVEEEIIFGEGDEGFAKVFTAESGLGPIFVETSCISCHIGDGRGHPFSQLKRFAKLESDGTLNYLEELGGPQLQHRSIIGHEAESIPSEATTVTTLIAPPNTGLGYLEAVPDADLLALADPTDADGDGISGVPNYITPPDFYTPFPFNSPNAEGQYIGRFGRKASAIDLLIQTVNAYQQDMGITSEFLPEEPQGAMSATHEPDVSTEEVESVVFYLQTLKVPEPRDQDDPDVMAGKQLFMDINCSGCHTPVLQTGDYFIEALSNQEFYPYSDLLLHDMGEELDDGYTEGSATTAEWRTPPLWGLGLSPDAQGGTYFLMHDGRAQSLDEAIMLHGGEGAQSREAYTQLSQEDKDRLIKFLESL